MEHFICTGECGGVSKKPGTCQDERCLKYGQAFLYCDCENPKHLSKLPQQEHTEEKDKKEFDTNPEQN